MNEARKVGIGFIGAGSVAEVHKAALERCEAARLAALYDVNLQRSLALAQGTDVRVCRSADELVGLDSVDAVFVLTPLETHFDNVIRALKARKHTFVEKPVSLSKDEVRQMQATAQANSVLCVPGHNYIHSAALKNARAMIQGGKIGDIYAAWIHFILTIPVVWSQRLSGVLREVMIHHFYSLLYLLGRPESVFATTSDPRHIGKGKEDQALVVCTMPNGAIANLFGSFCADDLTADPWTVLYKVLGSDGSVCHSWSMARFRNRPQPIWDLPSYWETFAEEDRYFVEECVGRGRAPLSTMDDVLTCLDILEAAETSIESKRAVRILGDKEAVVDGAIHQG